MELRQLRSFVTVASELNFTHAAARLHLTQSALSRQVHSLEDELGVLLFDRTKHPVSITEAGQSFLIDARNLVALSMESMKAVQRLVSGEPRRLVIGYHFNFSFDFLPATLSTFYQTCHSIDVTLLDMSPADQLLALEGRRIDLSFVGFRPCAERENAPVLAWERVARHDIVVALPARHPLSNASAISGRDLKSLFFVALSEQSHPGSKDWLSRFCQQIGFIPRILQNVNCESGIINFVAEGLGVALVREQVRSLAHPGVVFRPLATDAKADYWIAWHPENRSKALVRYIEILRREVCHRRESQRPLYRQEDNDDMKTSDAFQASQVKESV